MLALFLDLSTILIIFVIFVLQDIENIIFNICIKYC